MKLRLAASSACALFIVALSASDAGAQWVSTNGPAGAQTNAFTFRDGGTTLLAGTGGGGVFRANSPYTTWTRMNNGLTTTNVLSMATGVNEWGYETLLAGTQGGGVFAAWPNGAFFGFGNWSAWNRGLPTGVVRAVTAVPDPYFGYGMVLFTGTDNGVFRSNTGDVRIGWAAINTGLTNTLVRALAYIFDGSDENDGIGANDLFVGTSGGGVFLSTDGVRWWPKNTGLTNKNVSALAGSSTYGMLFAGTVGGGVFRSTYTWGGWTPINNGLSNMPVQALAAAGTNIFAGTAGGGVFVSTNDGQGRWTAVNSGLPNLAITALATDGTNLFAATGAGVFRRPLAEMINR